MTVRPRRFLIRAAVALGVTLIVAGLALAFLVMQVECPYCHNSDANVKGNCVLRQRTGNCGEDYYPEHSNKSTCEWCWGRGRMILPPTEKTRSTWPCRWRRIHSSGARWA